jgi:hypothetical protein
VEWGKSGPAGNVGNGFPQIGKHGRSTVLLYQRLDFIWSEGVLQLECCRCFNFKIEGWTVFRIISEPDAQVYLQSCVPQFMVNLELGMHFCVLTGRIEIPVEGEINVQDSEAGKFYVGVWSIHV